MEISWLQDCMEDKDSLTFLKRVGSMKKVAGDENERQC